ncbi:helix-turn-helix domain-containing protein [Brachybacterium muris]|nr:helix-turn-helix domain-containing protein [Brachybacterium muris]MCT1998864.1 helix-turn-helix domain-containing protein [Brachybacterium muris]
MDGSQKWKILRLHVEDGIPLASLARETGMGERTLSRWDSLYRTGDISGLERAQRADAGVRRTTPELVAFVEHPALTRPRPSIATLHRLVAAEATRRDMNTPSYATVWSIVQALDPGMVTLALEGPASYRNRHELVFHHRSACPAWTNASATTPSPTAAWGSPTATAPSRVKNYCSS